MVISISKIKVNKGRREINNEKVIELAGSIKEIGLLQPIVINQDNVLIAGQHRLEACKLLGRTEIMAAVTNVTGLKAELAEIDENLIRNDLHYIVRSDQLARRKEIYEILHPETKAGVAGGKASGISRRTSADSALVHSLSFAADTAQKTGVSKRVIHEELQLAKNLIPEAKEIARKADIPKVDALELSRMETEKQKAVADKIATGAAKTVRDAVREMKKAERQAEINEQAKNEVEMPDGLYSCIVIDPPWAYGTAYDPNSRRVANPYPEMEFDQLSKLDIKAKTDSILFLWTTHRFVWEAKALMDKWGFAYRSMLVWDKEKMGMGDLFRMQCEFCLVGIKGKPLLNNTHDLRDLIREPRREHSRKPEGFYEMVNTLCPGTKIEYFARSEREGYAVYGNDTNKF